MISDLTSDIVETYQQHDGDRYTLEHSRLMGATEWINRIASTSLFGPRTKREHARAAVIQY
ncbi:hypothetical protein ASE72_09175 [Sphingomonas sp. Leaf20]|nr:hypothetical protein ASE72_09175 [Sphingomonas sp. Leaf20]